MSEQKWKPNAYKLTHERFGHPAGTIVFDSWGHDYGCANDDSRSSGVEHTSVTLNADGSYPFFTVPRQHLVLHERCPLPPEGWWCSREYGHEGPCAARPDRVPPPQAKPPEPTIEELQAEIHRLNELMKAPPLDQQNQAWLAVWNQLVEEVPDYIKAQGKTPPITIAVEAIKMMSNLLGKQHAGLLWLLWNHQSPSNPVGRAARHAIGMGNFEKMSPSQIEQAQMFGEDLKNPGSSVH